MKWIKVDTNKFVSETSEMCYQGITIELIPNNSYRLRFIDCDVSQYTETEIAEATKGKTYTPEKLAIVLSEYFDNIEQVLEAKNQWELYWLLSSETTFNMNQIAEIQLHESFAHPFTNKVTITAKFGLQSKVVEEIELPHAPFVGMFIDTPEFRAIIDKVTWDGTSLIADAGLDYFKKNQIPASPITKWADLSDIAKSILEWVENPGTDKLETLKIEKGTLYDRFGVQSVVDEDLYQEILSYLPHNKNLQYSVEGNLITVALKTK